MQSGVALACAEVSYRVSTAKPATSLTAAEITAEKSAVPAYLHVQPTRRSFEVPRIHVYRPANSTIVDHLANRGDVR